MEQKKAFATWSLVVVLVAQVILLVVLYLVGGVAEAALFFGVGLAGAVVLAVVARQVTVRAVEQAAAARPVAAPAPQPELAPRPAPRPEPKAVVPLHAPAAAAVQVLSLLQRRGRLIDFLQEDLRQYDDAQIGAAVRNVHEGCRQALAEHVALEPIFDAAEGSQVTVAPGFDAHAIRLTGNVVGDPPFKGALQHRGWRIRRIDLPALMPGQENEMVLAPAEVEV